MNAGLRSLEDGIVEVLETRLSDEYSSTRRFGSVIAQGGVLGFSSGWGIIGCLINSRYIDTFLESMER